MASTFKHLSLHSCSFLYPLLPCSNLLYATPFYSTLFASSLSHHLHSFIYHFYLSSWFNQHRISIYKKLMLPNITLSAPAHSKTFSIKINLKRLFLHTHSEFHLFWNCASLIPNLNLWHHLIPNEMALSISFTFFIKEHV